MAEKAKLVLEVPYDTEPVEGMFVVHVMVAVVDVLLETWKVVMLTPTAGVVAVAAFEAPETLPAASYA